MNFSLPEAKEVLVLAPHPDDEALGCAGTLMLLNRKGVSSTVAFITDGEKIHGEPSSAIAQKRREEARRVSQMLGCKEPLFLGFPDGDVKGTSEQISGKLSEIISNRKPDIIFSPSPIDFHEDHIATAKISLRLLDALRSFRLAFHEIYSTVRFTHLIDITGVIEQKKQAILTYHTSLYGKPEVYVHAMLGLNAQRSLFPQKNGYYEGFWIVERPLNREEITDWLMYR